MAVLVLDSTLKTIKASIASTSASVYFTAHYGDSNGTTFSNGENDGTFSSSPQTLVAAPSSGYQRTIKYISIQNGSGSAATVTVYLDNNGSTRNIAVVTLNAGDTWSTDGTFDTNGSFKQVLGTINVSTVTGVLPIGNGGTGQTTQQAALNALAGGATSGRYLRGDGTNVSLSTIQAADVPTLNQNTTGTAAGLSATLAVGSGGTGETTYTDGQLLIGNTAGGLTKATLTAGTNVTITNGNGTITIAASGGGGGITTGKAIAMAMIFGF